MILTPEFRLTVIRSYYSGGNSVSFPKRYSKAGKGWDFDDILWTRSPGVRGSCVN